MSNSLESVSGQAIAWTRIASPAARRAVAAPTLIVAVAVYAGYGLLTWFFRDLPLWVVLPLGALWLAWYGSLQHETIHNHPTSSRRFNARLASLPLSLWIPYRIYRVTHLQHHRHGGRPLTDVSRDPESFYLHPGELARRGPVQRAVYRANCTLAGRLTLGPGLAVCRFWRSELAKIRAGDVARRTLWLRHAISVLPVLFWVTQVCHIPLLTYLLGMVYPSVALSLLRSFAEHRADAAASMRTVSVEANPFWSLLFLNNNLHIAHHAYPKLPWYQLPSTWRHLRSHAAERGLVLGGYGQVAGSYLLRPVISAEHPGPVESSPY